MEQIPASKVADSGDDTLVWTTSEAARQLRVSPRTVSRLVAENILPSVKIGRVTRIPKQAILDWIEAQTRYNWGCVESVQSHTGESLCDSINVTASTTLPTNQEVENRLDALLKPEANK